MKIKEFIWLLVLFCISLVYVNMSFGVFHLTNLEYFKIGDTMSYIDAADRIMTRRQIHPLRTMGYPLVLLIPYYLFHTSAIFFRCVQSIQCLMLFMNFIMIFSLIKFYTNATKAWIGIILLMLNITYMVFAFQILTEMGCLFIAISATYLAHLYFKTKRISWLIMSYSLVCLISLFRPGFIYLNLLILIVLILYFLIIQKSILYAIVIILITASSIGVHANMMKQSYGLTKLSFIDDITMYRYFNTSVDYELQSKHSVPELLELRDHKMDGVLKLIPDSNYYLEYHNYVKNESMQLVMNHKAAMLKAYFFNLVSNTHTGNTVIRDLPIQYASSEKIKKTWFNITRIWNMLFVISLILYQFIFIVRWIQGAIKFFECNKLSLFLIIYSDYCFFISGISFYQGDRFNIIWMPLFLIAVIISLSNHQKSSAKA